MSRRRIPPPQHLLFAEGWMLPADETVILHMHPNQSRLIHPFTEAWNLPVGLHWNQRQPDRFNYRYIDHGLMIVDPRDQDQWLPGRRYSDHGLMIVDPRDQDQWLPDHHYGVVDGTLIFESSDRSVSRDSEAPSEKAIANHVQTRSSFQASGDRDGVCVVCQDDLVEDNRKLIARLDCGHEYHPHCIQKWLMIKNSCPMCKATIV